jgi:hypothetical protein
VWGRLEATDWASVTDPVAAQPGPDLAEAEVIARHVSALNPWAGVVMKEYDRRGSDVERLRSRTHELQERADKVNRAAALRGRRVAATLRRG